MANLYRDRIREFTRLRAGDLQADERNYREHSVSQRAALEEELERIGWWGAVLVRELDDGGYMIVDGHLRADIAPDEEVPALVLDVDEDEAAEIMLTHDAIGAMAHLHKSKLDALIEQVNPGERIDALLKEVRERYDQDVEWQFPEEPEIPVAELQDDGENPTADIIVVVDMEHYTAALADVKSAVEKYAGVVVK